MKKFNLKPFLSSQSNLENKQKKSYVLVCMPINKADHIEGTFSRIKRIFEPEFEVVRIEGISGDWVAVLREHTKNASLICFEMSRVNQAFNQHVLRELAYVTTMILDWQAEHDIAPMFLFMHRDELLSDKPNYCYAPAHEIDPVLCHGEGSSDLNSIVGRRSICVFDYHAPNAMSKFEQRLHDLKTFIIPNARPQMFNLVVTPYDERHPILKSATWASGFVPYYLRDDQYDGFALANTSMTSEPNNSFWDNIQRVFRFSTILRHHIQLWLSRTDVPASVKYKLLVVIRTAMASGYKLEYGFAKVLKNFVDTEDNLMYLDLVKEILIPQESEEEFKKRFLEPIKPAKYDKCEVISNNESQNADLISVVFPTNLAKAIRFNENKDWASFFQYEDRAIHKMIANGSFVQSRFFNVSGISHSGLFEDTLDKIGNSIRETVRQMIACHYTEQQIEQTVRATIIVSIIKLLLRNFDQGKTLIREGDPDNIIEIIWGTPNLYRFEFQSSAMHRVIRSYIPWNIIKETAMRYAAKKAAKIIEVEYEEFYQCSFKDVDFPPAQVWAALLSTQLFEVCTIDMLRDWWVKYAIPEYVQRGQHERLIVDPQQINRWAPEEYA